MRNPRVLAALFFTALGGYLAYRVHQVPWVPQADFDIIGFLWVLSNLPKLVTWGGVLFVLGIAGYLWITALASIVSANR